MTGAITVDKFITDMPSTCGHPACKDKSCDELFLHPKCHPKRNPIVAYHTVRKILSLRCGECNRVIVNLALAAPREED